MSEYCQNSFLGGMNLLADDTRIQPNQYRLGFNVRSRYDVLDLVRDSTLDVSLPAGIKQEIITFGNYVIAFVAGNAYYRLYSSTGWIQIVDFHMSRTAPRYWTCAVPLATTNYIRLSQPTITAGVVPNANAPLLQAGIVEGTANGNLPGLLVQDNINQPLFIYLDAGGNVQVRVTKNYDNWTFNYDVATGILISDDREYVPIGNSMAFDGVILYITSQDYSTIYQSVSGRPLDFVRNVLPDGTKGGDATTTSYSVGVGNISTLRATADGGIFVAAGNSNFILTKNTANNIPTIFGEFRLIRNFLFESTCLNDRCIIDSLGDTRFIDLNGVRSFNAVQQLKNEGRNSPFSSTIARVLSNIVQDVAAAILFNDFEFYALNTTFGPVIAVYDTLSQCWSSFDTTQTGGSKVKQFTKIELGVQRLYAITTDDKMYVLYTGNTFARASVLPVSVTSTLLSGNNQEANAKNEIKLTSFRCVLSKIVSDGLCNIVPHIDNRASSAIGLMTKEIIYSQPTFVSDPNPPIPDEGTQLTNCYFPTPNCEQGWKTSVNISWNVGSLVQLYMEMRDVTPMNPLVSQATTR